MKDADNAGHEATLSHLSDDEKGALASLLDSIREDSRRETEQALLNKSNAAGSQDGK